MARIKDKLKVKRINSIKEPGKYSDGGGLYLQVSKSITKSWLFIYKRDGKKHELGLGSLDARSLAKARDEATKYRELLAEGIDPLTEKRKAKQDGELTKALTKTFKQCAEAYIDSKKHEWSSASHAKQWENTLRDHCYPIIGELSVAAIDHHLIMRCLEPIWLTKTVTANRVRGRIESILGWATVHGYRTGENPARWHGYLDNLLSKPSKVQSVKHHPALPYGEMHPFMEQLSHQDSTVARCLEFTILTAARTDEALGAVWSEIDFDAKIWTIPAERMKADKEHKVPLSDKCMSLLNKMNSLRLNDFIFPGRRNGLSSNTMRKLLARMDRKDITVHGFRSSFRDWAAESTKHYPENVLDMCLAHTIKNQAEAAYRRGDLLEKRFIIMNDWAEYCYTERGAADNIVQLRS